MSDLINRQTAIERIRGQMIHGVACGKEIQEYYEGLSCAVNILAGLPSAEPEIEEQLYQHKCYITDKEGLQHEVIHTGDIRRITGWEI